VKFAVGTVCRSAMRYSIRIVVIVGVAGASLVFPQQVAWGAPETRTDKFDVVSGDVIDLSFPATHAAVSWTGEDSAVVNLRGSQDGENWSEYQPVNVDEEPGDEAAGLVILDNASKIEVQVESGEVADLEVQAIDTENGPRRLEMKSSVPEASAIDGHTPMPEVLRRNQWGANEGLRRGSPAFAKIGRFVVHHTATANNDPNPAATVRAILSWHTSGNGWNDIGYNYLIDQQGRIYEGRYAGGGATPGENSSKRGVIGAHAVGANTGSVGISMLGNFVGSRPSEAQLTSLKRLIAWGGDRYNVDLGNSGNVVGHRDVGQTTCPGDGAYNLLGQVRDDAQALKAISYPAGDTPGYWVAGSDGRVANYGNAVNYGSMAGKGLNGEITAMTRTSSGRGYWLMGTDGGIFSFGDAKFHGSMGGKPLNQPIVGLAPTPSGNGYWLVARDGGIFAFGDAKFFGSMGGKPLNQPVVGMSATSDGKGYWLVAADGGIFSYGSARFHGSTGSIRLAQPIVSMATAPGGGYWLMARDGGVFAFDARFFGSVPMLKPNSYAGTKQTAATQTGRGYYLLANDGGIYTFGDARFHGAPTGTMKAAGMAIVPKR
jgi:hypothetical protein